MGRVSEETLAVKYEKILAHLRATQPEPQTIREIAEAIGQPVDESGLRTLRNWLATLEQKGFIHQQERGKYVLLKAPGKIKAVQLEPEELMALLLAARSLTAQQDRANLTIEVAIVKLARALTDDAAGELMRLIEQEYASRYPKGLETEQDIFRTIMRAFLNRLPVVIEYVTFDKPTTLNIYWIEPVAISRAIYLIGHSSLQNGLRTYRLDRVQSAKIVPNAEPYLPPQEYRSPEFLRKAWSIFHGNELKTVVARFAPGAPAKRIAETRWHPSQKEVVPDPDKPGWVRWEIQVAEPREVLAWLRSWGADCEVLEPSELRDEMMGGIRRLTWLYEITGNNLNNIQQNLQQENNNRMFPQKDNIASPYTVTNDGPKQAEDAPNELINLLNQYMQETKSDD